MRRLYCAAFGFAVTAGGGTGKLEHLPNVIPKDRANAALAASLLPSPPLIKRGPTFPSILLPETHDANWTDISIRRLHEGRDLARLRDHGITHRRAYHGKSVSNAREILGHVIATGLLTSPTEKGTVRLGLPAEALDTYFPGLFATLEP